MSWKPVKKNREGTQIPQGGMTNYLQRIEAHDDLTEDNVHGTIIWNVEPYPHKTSNIDTNLSKIDANLPWHKIMAKINHGKSHLEKPAINNLKHTNDGITISYGLDQRDLKEILLMYSCDHPVWIMPHVAWDM